MPSLKDTKRRILSVKNTQKITRAMKLVSSAKYARANHAALNSRPYGESFDKMVARLVGVGDLSSPLLRNDEEQKSLVVIIATDRGLCGGLNSNLIKKTTQFIQELCSRGGPVDLILWGRRAEIIAKQCSHLDVNVVETQQKVLEKPSYNFAYKQVRKFQEKFIGKEYNRVYCAYSKFESALTQTPVVSTLLPVRVGSHSAHQVVRAGESDYIIEPNRERVLDSLLEKKVANQMFRSLLEGAASEHAARMTAMDNATNNADQVINRLTIEYNRARQAAITKELIEITSGAEAL